MKNLYFVLISGCNFLSMLPRLVITILYHLRRKLLQWWWKKFLTGSLLFILSFVSKQITLKYQISVPQVIRVPQQKSTLKTGQISWNKRSEDREIANYHSPIHSNSCTCQFKGIKVIFGGKSLRTTGNFGLELIKVPVLLFDTLE